MTDRVAVVTGAARGIGAATVRRLAAGGVRVAAVDWCIGDAMPELGYPQATEDELFALADEHPGSVLPIIADVRDAEALQRAAEQTRDRWGRIDIAVAGAAVIAGGEVAWRTSTTARELLWDIDVTGVWNTAEATIPFMLDGPDPAGCRFVAVASAAGTRGLYRLTAYNAAKHAVVGIVRGLAADLVGTGVAAIAVSPGSTRTAMLQATAEIYELDDVEEFAASQSLGRLLEPDEIAATLALCCSRDGAALHGSVVEATGGFAG